MRPGRPMTAGTSKPSNTRTNTISMTDTMVGSINGRVTTRSVVNQLAPLTLADSSSDGSIDFKAADMSRKTSGDAPRPSTHIMPGSVYTLNGESVSPNAVFAMELIQPICGLSRKSQAIVVTMPGMMIGTIATT